MQFLVFFAGSPMHAGAMVSCSLVIIDAGCVMLTTRAVHWHRWRPARYWILGMNERLNLFHISIRGFCC